jgi:hypothetical protein
MCTESSEDIQNLAENQNSRSPVRNSPTVQKNSDAFVFKIENKDDIGYA